MVATTIAAAIVAFSGPLSVAPPRHRVARPIVCGAASYLAEVPQGAPDAILGIAQAFRESTAPNKVNLAVGAYRDENGVPWVLPSVREASQRLLGARCLQ